MSHPYRRAQSHRSPAEFASGVLIQEVVRELAIHPFLLSRWRKEVRAGEIVATPIYGWARYERGKENIFAAGSEWRELSLSA
ncbi:MAG TPA: hypothetical protein VGX03_10460 [Candidatus Binatia bacterium]|nr:hypothetical protein [Candidatus Binatia bacterium]